VSQYITRYSTAVLFADGWRSVERGCVGSCYDGDLHGDGKSRLHKGRKYAARPPMLYHKEFLQFFNFIEGDEEATEACDGVSTQLIKGHVQL
jgi:hypothetical protein